MIVIPGTVTDKMLDYLGRLIHPSDDETSEAIRAALHSSPGDYQPVAVGGALIEPVFTSECSAPKPPPFIKSNTFVLGSNAIFLYQGLLLNICTDIILTFCSSCTRSSRWRVGIR